jgi:hypothetical protein
MSKNTIDRINTAFTKKEEELEITRTWVTGHNSCTLIIPKDFAKQYGLDKPTHVIVKGTSEGILIKKLEV